MNTPGPKEYTERGYIIEAYFIGYDGHQYLITYTPNNDSGYWINVHRNSADNIRYASPPQFEIYDQFYKRIEKQKNILFILGCIITVLAAVTGVPLLIK